MICIMEFLLVLFKHSNSIFLSVTYPCSVDTTEAGPSTPDGESPQAHIRMSMLSDNKTVRILLMNTTPNRRGFEFLNSIPYPEKTKKMRCIMTAG